MSIPIVLLGTALILLVLAYVLHPILRANRNGVAGIGNEAATDRVCARCGVRPESDAAFCSRCGQPVVTA